MATGQLSAPAPFSSGLRLPGVPVLLYHGLHTFAGSDAVSRNEKYWVTAGQFRQHLACIRQHGGRGSSVAELCASSHVLRNGTRAVVLTFDDGQVSDYEIAFPALVENGLRAESFVNTSTVGQAGYLSWGQIAEMQRHGMSFQSHSHDHIALTRLTERDLQAQLDRSKGLLEDRTGQPVRFLAAPYGLWNRRVFRAAKHCGYRAICTSRPWPARLGASRVSRTAIYGHTALDEFRRLLACDPLPYAARSARYAFLHLPKRLLLRWSPRQLSVRVLEKRV